MPFLFFLWNQCIRFAKADETAIEEGPTRVRAGRSEDTAWNFEDATHATTADNERFIPVGQEDATGATPIGNESEDTAWNFEDATHATTADNERFIPVGQEDATRATMKSSDKMKSIKWKNNHL